MLTSQNFQNKVTKSKVSIDIDLTKELDGLSSTQRTELKRIVGETLLDSVNSSTLKKTSAVDNRPFQKLSKEYRKFKMSQGKVGQPNLHLTDQMMSDLFSQNKTNGVSLKITNALSKKKAENHNHGVTVPKRQYLPTASGQGFKRSIMTAVNSKIREYRKEVLS